MLRVAVRQVGLECNAMMACSLIHSSILKTGRAYVSTEDEADFIMRARTFALRYVWGGGVSWGGGG